MDADDHFPAAKRIVTEIQNIVNRDPKLWVKIYGIFVCETSLILWIFYVYFINYYRKEFDLVIQPESQNKSPVIYIDHCLGLESWCVRHVYKYVNQKLITIRKRLKKQSITIFWLNKNGYLQFQILVLCFSKNIYVVFYLVSNETIPLLTSALLLNPEVTTFWNMRRELVIDGYLKPNDELHFASVVLHFKPKCAEIFSYRRWIFFNVLKGKVIYRYFVNDN